MPAYSFQERFADDILSGQKRHTIRRRRKRATRPGDRLYLYIGMRTKRCRLIGEAKCSGVESINIYPGRLVIRDGRRMSKPDIDTLAKCDGFENTDEFFSFFEERYGLPTFDMELIHWEMEFSPSSPALPPRGEGRKANHETR